MSYLEALPGTPPCPRGFNPSSWMLDVLAGSDSSGGGEGVSGGAAGSSPPQTVPQPQPEQHQLVVAVKPPLESSAPTPTLHSGAQAGPPGEGLQAAYFSSELWRGTRRSAGAAAEQGEPVQGGADKGATPSPAAGIAETFAALCTPEPGSSPVRFSSTRARGAWPQFVALVRRQWLAYLRNIPFNVGRLGATSGLMLLFGIIYLGLASRAGDLAGVQVCGARDAAPSTSPIHPAIRRAAPAVSRGRDLHDCG